jgi:hypothetical protein
MTIYETIDEFAEAMKKRCRQKAKQGYSGWDGRIGWENIFTRMIYSAAKSNFVDVANFAMMLWIRSGQERK